MAKGKIKVESGNIFPVIKKFLYSDHEIFLRELVSNAIDASLKLKALKQAGEFKGDVDNLMIEVKVDKDAKTISVIDNGIGMTEEETKKYLNQMAFSGAEEFLQKYEKEGKEAGIIGHFGLGFYSAFMVAKKVEVNTKSYTDAPAVQWSCLGDPEYTLKKIDKEDRGTEIVIHLDDDSLEFAEESRVAGILEKYCKFLPVPIKFGTKTEWYDDPSGEKDDNGNVKQLSREVDNIINNPNPAWTKKPAGLKEEDYKSFYRELYPATFEEPLFHIHLNVDYPFNLTGILYFPKLSKNNIQVQKNKIQLYSNQVFITDNVENIVPEFLTILHGVIDSPDIPLNVSRSYLQEDKQVKQISSHISKKVADKLASMFKKDREDFEKKWDDIKVFMEYGALTDDKFFGRIKKSLLFKNTEKKYFTLKEYEEKIKENQTDKDGKVVYLYTDNPDAQHVFIETAKNKGYDVLVFDTPLTPHYVQFLETKLEKASFTRVDADTIDKLIKKDEDLKSNLTEEQEKELKEVIEKLVDTKEYTVQFEPLTENDAPVIITRPEFMRRMKDQQALGGGMMMGDFPEMFNLVVNANHPLTSKILVEQDANKKSDLAQQAIDLALLSQNMLKGDKLSAFLKRSVELID